MPRFTQTFKTVYCFFIQALVSTCLFFGSPAKAQVSREPRFILMIYASGGWDPTMVFDNKIGSPYIDLQSGLRAANGAGSIPFVTHADRPAANTWFQKYGANAVIVNGLYTPAMERKTAFSGMFTASPVGKNRPVDFLTYYAASLKPTLAAPHIVFDAPYAPGDFTHVAIKLTKLRLNEYLAGGVPTTISLTSTQETAIDEYQKRVWAKKLDALHQNSLDGDKVRAIYGQLLREKTIGKELRAASSRLGSQGSESNLLRYGKLALELFATNTSLCATVQAGRTQYWDTSFSHVSRQSAGFQYLFADLSMIMAHASSLGLSDRLTIIVASEMGKSPRLNEQGGKNPWPFTSVLLWGSLFRGGTVHGSTDKFLRGVPTDPIFGDATSDAKFILQMGNIFSALYLTSGVPSKLILPEYKPLSSILRTETEGGLR